MIEHQLARNHFATAKSYVRQAHNLIAMAKGKSEACAAQRSRDAASCRQHAVDNLRQALLFLRSS